uniref:Putative ribonuclease H-like domain-containing protein n=1 Tax=Tanacetum cinerariifolium TaxID=118510 RepID=A0A6L2KTT2_TANCI|nr:putative ribonuclease H-like domain-containing protein [Tanacetum cinerariifolium]
MANEQEDHALVADEEASTEFALMDKTSAESEVFDNSLCSKNCKKNTESLNSKIADLTDKLSDSKNMLFHYKVGLSQVERRLVEFKKQEIKFCEKIRGLEVQLEFKINRIESLTNELEFLKKEKGELDTKLTGFQTASKDLDNLLESQRLDKNKEGHSPAIESTSNNVQNRNSFETEASSSTISSKPFIKFVKATVRSTKNKTVNVESIKKPVVKYAEQYRKPSKKSTVRGNQRNWNNLKSQRLGENFEMKNRACFYYGYFDHISYDYGLRVKKRRSCPKNNCSNKSITPRAVIHKPYRPPMRPVRPNMNVAQTKRTSFHKLAHSYSKRPFQRTSAVRSQYRAPWVPTVNRNFPTVNRKFPTVNRKFPTGNIKFSTANMGKRRNAVKASAVVPRTTLMTKAIGIVAALGGCKITGKGTIKIGKLEFENVYFVKYLKYNLFSVSQICDNKNSVLFTDSECIVLKRNFKLTDDTNVLLRTLIQHNMYSIDLNNIIPHKDLTCLVAKASADECMLWHRRLGHLNFKTMNKLVRHNLVRGLPTKCFENDHTCTACLKGKQHKASCKSKLVNSVTKPLHTLHMDLFGPTSVSSISHKWYCLVVTDDFSRFTWTFFLKTKDETSGILRKFITKIKNLKDLKVKIISVTMGENLEIRRTPAIGFLKPFGCHVMILNTLDNLGKFKAKGDEGYFIGYSMSNKAFRIFNKRTKRVEENLHVDFLENKAIEKGAGLNWLFDIDSLTKSMNYVRLQVHDALLESFSSKPQDDCSADVPESSGNLNPTASLTNPPTDQMETLIVETPIPSVISPVLTACFTDSQEPSSDTRLLSKRVANQVETPSLDNILTLTNRFEDILGVTTNSVDSDGVEAGVSNMETTIITSPTPTLRIHKDHPKSQIIGLVDTPIQTRHKSKESLVDCPKGVRPIGTKWVLKNKKDERGIIIINKARLVAQGHTHEEGIDYDEVFAPIVRIKAIRIFLAYASLMGFTVYQVVVKSAFLYGTIDEEVEFEALMHEKIQMSAMGELNFFLSLQVLQKEDGIFLSQDKYVGDILKKFRYSDVRSSNTPMEKENPYGKDGTRKDVHLHLYRSMIRSLMYLTASRPDIMFDVCACDRHQVTPKECHLHAVKRIFRYLKGHPKLGLWIETTEEGTKILATVDGKLRTVSESSIRRNFKLNDEAGIRPFSHQWKYLIHTIMQCLSPKSTGFNEFSSNIATALVCLATNRVYNFSKMIFDGMVRNINNKVSKFLMQYTRRTRIVQSLVLPPVADEHASPFGDASQGKACPTDSGFAPDQDRANIAKTFTMPSDSTPRVTSLVADEGSMQQKLDELTTLCTSLQRRLDEGEEAAERISDDTEEMTTVLTSMVAARILTSGGVQMVPTVAKIATATVSIPTGSGVVSTASPTIPTAASIFTTTESTLYTRRKVEWKLYDTCGVHHVTSKDKEIFMLVEKDYPLRKGLAIGMISYKLQVENYSKMENDLILKI